MKIAHIVACGENGVIGDAGQIPWKSREDWKFFKDTTMGHCMLMGRKTYESIGRPLPGRKTIVLTRDKSFRADPQVAVVHDLNEALHVAESLVSQYPEPFFIVGGAEIYRQTLDLTDEIFLTEVHGNYRGDAFYAGVPVGFLRKEKREVEADPPVAFCHYVRTSAKPKKMQ